MADFCFWLSFPARRDVWKRPTQLFGEQVLAADRWRQVMRWWSLKADVHVWSARRATVCIPNIWIAFLWSCLMLTWMTGWVSLSWDVAFTCLRLMCLSWFSFLNHFVDYQTHILCLSKPSRNYCLNSHQGSFYYRSISNYNIISMSGCILIGYEAIINSKYFCIWCVPHIKLRALIKMFS